MEAECFVHDEYGGRAHCLPNRQRQPTSQRRTLRICVVQLDCAHGGSSLSDKFNEANSACSATHERSRQIQGELTRYRRDIDLNALLGMYDSKSALLRVTDPLVFSSQDPIGCSSIAEIECS
jgi:hypothetical protein